MTARWPDTSFLWNSRYLERAAELLRNHGHAIDDGLLTHVWPLGWEHINLTGDYTWTHEDAGSPARLRALRLDQLPPPRPSLAA